MLKMNKCLKKNAPPPKKKKAVDLPSCVGNMCLGQPSEKYTCEKMHGKLLAELAYTLFTGSFSFLLKWHLSCLLRLRCWANLDFKMEEKKLNKKPQVPYGTDDREHQRHNKIFRRIGKYVHALLCGISCLDRCFALMTENALRLTATSPWRFGVAPGFLDSLPPAYEVSVHISEREGGLRLDGAPPPAPVGTGGYPIHQEIGRQSSYVTGGIPLAFMQEDFLVKKWNPKSERISLAG